MALDRDVKKYEPCIWEIKQHICNNDNADGAWWSWTLWQEIPPIIFSFSQSSMSCTAWMFYKVMADLGPSWECVTWRSFTVEVMDSKGRVLLVLDSVDCRLWTVRNIPARETVPLLLLHLDVPAGLVPVTLLGHGKEIPFFRGELSVVWKGSFLVYLWKNKQV